jgi:hypothetical protein
VAVPTLPRLMSGHSLFGVGQDCCNQAEIAEGSSKLSKEGEHGRILATAARAALTPLGFWQKGRSRIWLADRGFWLTVVEFQPSGWSKGSYLNVAAHWLWSTMPEVLSFDYMFERQNRFVEFEDAGQFTPLAKKLAGQAAEESRALETLFAGMHSTAAELVERAKALRGWPTFDAAVATGLIGDMATSKRLFAAAMLDEWRPDLRALLVPYAEAIVDAAEFRSFIELRINAHRAKYGLDHLSTLTRFIHEAA